MVSILGIGRSIAKGVTRTFGSSAVCSPKATQGTSIFADALKGSEKVVKESGGRSEVLSIWEALKISCKRLISTKNLGLQKADVSKLESIEGIKFFEEARNLIGQKMGIPVDLFPVVELAPKLANPRQYACFAPSTFRIFVSEAQVSGVSKAKQFALFAHEMQHCEQFLMILRSKKAAPAAISFYSKDFGKSVADSAITNAKNLSMEYFEKLVQEKKLPPEALEYVKIVKAANPAEIDKLRKQSIEENTASCAEGLKNLQKTVVEKMGALSGSYDFVADMYLKSLIKSSLSDSKGLRYILNRAELEAYGRQGCVCREYEKLLK